LTHRRVGNDGAMRFQHETTYAAAAADVYATVIDARFREAVCSRQGALRHSVQILDDSDGVKVLIDQVLPAHGIPAPAAKFVGEEIQVRRVELWVTPTHANIDISIPGKPGRLEGTLVLSESAGRTTRTLDSQLTVSIPFVGGKLESLIADLFTTALDTEAEVAASFLKPTADPA
jgi:Protein of unknown function (DUF2505)